MRELCANERHMSNDIITDALYAFVDLDRKGADSSTSKPAESNTNSTLAGGSCGVHSDAFAEHIEPR